MGPTFMFPLHRKVLGTKTRAFTCSIYKLLKAISPPLAVKNIVQHFLNSAVLNNQTCWSVAAIELANKDICTYMFNKQGSQLFWIFKALLQLS